MTIPEDIKSAFWVLVSFGAYKLFGWVPVVLVLIYLIICGVNEKIRPSN